MTRATSCIWALNDINHPIWMFYHSDKVVDANRYAHTELSTSLLRVRTSNALGTMHEYNKQSCNPGAISAAGKA